MTFPWPPDARGATRWIRGAAQEAGLRGLEKAKVIADIAGNDLRELIIDATGVHLRLPKGEDSSLEKTGDSAPEPVLRQRGYAHSVRFFALPLRVRNLPLHVDIRLWDVPFCWVAFAAPVNPRFPHTQFGIDSAPEGALLRGSARLSVAAKDLSKILTALARPFLSAERLRLRNLTCAVLSEGEEELRATAKFRLRYGLLPLSLRAEAQVHVTRDGLITLRSLSLRSGNPLVKIGLFLARTTWRSLPGKSIDLNKELAKAGTRVHDLRITAGANIVLEGRFAQRASHPPSTGSTTPVT